MNSSQDECTLGGRGGVLDNKQGQTRREGEGSKLGNLERTYFWNVPLKLLSATSETREFKHMYQIPKRESIY